MWPVGEAQLLKWPREAGGMGKSTGSQVSDGQAPDGDRTSIQEKSWALRHPCDRFDGAEALHHFCLQSSWRPSLGQFNPDPSREGVLGDGSSVTQLSTGSLPCYVSEFLSEQAVSLIPAFLYLLSLTVNLTHLRAPKMSLGELLYYMWNQLIFLKRYI